MSECFRSCFRYQTVPGKKIGQMTQLVFGLLEDLGVLACFSISRGSEFGSPARSSEFYGNSSGSYDGGSDSGGD